MIQAVLVAGDRGGSRSINGQSKAFLPFAGRPMVVHVLKALLLTPQVSGVFVVGDAIRLEEALTKVGCRARYGDLDCPLHIVPQGESLVENVRKGFACTLPASARDQYDPILVLPCDIPFVTPCEISQFVERACAVEADCMIGLSPMESPADYAPPEIQMASFNLREGRYRHNNLYLVRHLPDGERREYVQVMYDCRYQKEWRNMLRVIRRVFLHDVRNLWMMSLFLILHLGGVLHRRGHRSVADWIRRFVSIRSAERAMSRLLGAQVVCVVSPGRAVLDIDNANDLAAAEAMFPKEPQSPPRGLRCGVCHGPRRDALP